MYVCLYSAFLAMFRRIFWRKKEKVVSNDSKMIDSARHRKKNGGRYNDGISYRITSKLAYSQKIFLHSQVEGAKLHTVFLTKWYSFFSHFESDITLLLLSVHLYDSVSLSPVLL